MNSYFNGKRIEWIKDEPYVNDYGIYRPVNPYHQKGSAPAYVLVMTKEMFIEAYKKYIFPNCGARMDGEVEE